YQPTVLTEPKYFRRSAQSQACANPNYSNQIYVNVLPVNRSIWLGTIDSDWDKPGNWQCDIPNYTTNVIIPLRANQPYIYDGVLGKCNTIKIEPGAHLHIQTGGRLNVKEP